jgi:molybdate transport system permease protein
MSRRGLSQPRGVGALAAMGLALVAFPLLAIVIRQPWSGLWRAISAESSLDALLLSLRTSTFTTAVVFVIGLPLAWVLARSTRRLMSIVRAICVLPMVLPPVVGGVALLYAFGRNGVVGGALNDWLGIRLAFTETAVVLSQFFVAAPFFIVVMESAFQQIDNRLIGAARTLGAGPWYTLRRVVLPIAKPSLVAGLVLTWARALGEFGATITFAGNTPGRTQTLPLAIYSALESGDDAALALSFLMMVLSLLILVGLRDKWLPALRRSTT